jgi:hypothetical protein
MLLYEGLKKCDKCLSPTPPVQTVETIQIPEVVVKIISNE